MANTIKELTIKNSVFSSKITTEQLDGLGLKLEGANDLREVYTRSIDQKTGQQLKLTRYGRTNKITIQYLVGQDVEKEIHNNFSNLADLLHQLSVIGIEFD